MTHTAERKASQVQQPLKKGALRRNLGTINIISVAFSGGSFGLTWLAVSSVTTFLLLMAWQGQKQQILS